jgi:hypothetical protein
MHYLLMVLIAMPFAAIAQKLWPAPTPLAFALIGACIYALTLMVWNLLGQSPPLLSWVGLFFVTFFALMCAFMAWSAGDRWRARKRR